jgi:hypothetical protein
MLGVVDQNRRALAGRIGPTSRFGNGIHTQVLGGAPRTPCISRIIKIHAAALPGILPSGILFVGHPKSQYWVSLP